MRGPRGTIRGPSRVPQPRRITLGGREAIALTVAEYEQLIAGRRQIGGQSAELPAYEAFLSQRVMTIPRIRNVTSHFTMKTVKPGPGS
ncbi:MULTISPECIES: hypothetical protein [unclassified Streptomyces]|uniref:hypothetical protein n=1 Tax=unclassified Streptomyces TaxID=2593676 RepID=UPI002256391F|nr:MULTISPECIES: hypothetical protein [unclassified Streptomyces]MCX5061979.1 Lrp/AsnC ligand binding domain-containing protein [Streptomyces sp. NBC_00452]MCX5292412.1 Lrp/AsnC ligand binding domain-containing protein [Streptomyces sp. NBC_00183]